MSTYMRQPKKATARCPVPGCEWVRTYFELQIRRRIRSARGPLVLLETWTPETRAQLGLEGHIQRKHRAKTLINGR